MGPINLFSSDDLLEQLAHDTPELRAALGHVAAKRPHWDVLQSYFLTDDVEKRERWAQCLWRLIELKAPVDHTSQDTNQTLVMAMSFGSWHPTKELTAELLRGYLAAGLYDPTTRIPGKLRRTSNEREDDGLLPLASAILWDNDGAVRVLCEQNVSWQLGQVVRYGPQMDAFEFAAECRSPKCLAVLAEFVMRKALDARPMQEAVAAAPHSRRRGMAV
jgi:hypothetical protein